jgi:pantoate--beta-alanine ligase
VNVAHDRRDLVAARAELGRDGRRVALVPTMGALHDGHIALIRAVGKHADEVVVSIFVNPLQFGPGEDLDRYPRMLEADLDVCRNEGVSCVFAPTIEVMYPTEAQVTVAPGPLAQELEGADRPGHFAGVLTVVAKLFHLVRPHCAAFGEKDYQQLVLIRRMVRDLDFPVEVIPVPIVREGDGLARSSRNRYLSAGQRRSALALSAALRAGAAEGAAGGGSAAVRAAARAALADAVGLEPSYVELRDPDLGPAPVAGGPARLLVAARVGATRLIDNAPVLVRRRG